MGRPPRLRPSLACFLLSLVAREGTRGLLSVTRRAAQSSPRFFSSSKAGAGQNYWGARPADPLPRVRLRPPPGSVLGPVGHRDPRAQARRRAPRARQPALPAGPEILRRQGLGVARRGSRLRARSCEPALGGAWPTAEPSRSERKMGRHGRRIALRPSGGASRRSVAVCGDGARVFVNGRRDQRCVCWSQKSWRTEMPGL